MSETSERVAALEDLGWYFRADAFIATLGTSGPTIYGSDEDDLCAQVELWESGQAALKPEFRHAEVQAREGEEA